MKKKITELKVGDIVKVGKKFYDVYGEPTPLESGGHLFALVKHGDIDKVNSMTYVTPAHLSYEVSLNFKNEKINVVTEDDIEKHNEAMWRRKVGQLEDDWESRMATYKCRW